MGARTMSTFHRLRWLLAETLRVNEASIAPDSSLRELFTRSGGDSLDRVEFIMALEEEFEGFELPDEAAEKWDEFVQNGTVQQLADFIDQTQDG
jgi:acyl carrier protein